MLIESKSAYWRQTFRDNWFYILFLIFLTISPHIVGWLTDSSPFGVARGARTVMRGDSAIWMSVLIEIFALAILVMSYNLMFGFTGVISFGHALFFGLGGYIVGMMWEYTSLDPTLSFVISIIVTLAITGVIGLLVGLATLRLRGVYFAIFTLAIAEMVWIFISNWSVTKGEDGFSISQLPEWLDPSQNRLNLYYIGLFFFVFTFVFIRRLIHSPAGSVFQAIRENEERARTIGYNTLRYKLLAITVAAMLAGLAGILQGTLNKKLGPDMFSVSFTVDALLMTIIGGVGTFTGPVLGTAGLHLLTTQFRDLQIVLGDNIIDVSKRWLLILGVIFVVVVLIFPYGIVGTWRQLQQRLFRRVKRPPNPHS